MLHYYYTYSEADVSTTPSAKKIVQWLLTVELILAIAAAPLLLAAAVALQFYQVRAVLRN